MNNNHQCYCCDSIEVCDWGYDDDECGIYGEPWVICSPCWTDCRDAPIINEAVNLGILVV